MDHHDIVLAADAADRRDVAEPTLSGMRQQQPTEEIGGVKASL
jgi:hypothetical protein